MRAGELMLSDISNSLRSRFDSRAVWMGTLLAGMVQESSLMRFAVEFNNPSGFFREELHLMSNADQVLPFETLFVQYINFQKTEKAK